jgi:hypothetical protein
VPEVPPVAPTPVVTAELVDEVDVSDDGEPTLPVVVVALT